MFQCCEKEEGWEKGKEKGGKIKEKKKKDTCNGFYQKYGKKVGEPKDNKKKWNEATTERKDDMQKRV